MKIVTLLSPSKSLEYKQVPSWVQPTAPEFLDEAGELAEKISTLGPKLAKTLGVSEKIAELNRDRYDMWSKETHTKGQPAIFAYSGDVYNGLQAGELSQADVEYAQDHIRILTGLYGVLRPLDRIEPYRLEMGTRLTGRWGKNLYDFWGSKLASSIESTGPAVVLNCASAEYSKAAIGMFSRSLQVISPVFLHASENGEPAQKALFSKYARGLMARWMVENRIGDIKRIPEFDLEGYTYDEGRSTTAEPVFVAPASFSLVGRFVKK